MRLSLLLFVSLSALLAHAAPIPTPEPGTNPKFVAAPAVVDPVAAALASKLATINKNIGKLPVLPLPNILEPTMVPAIKVFANVKAGVKTRRAVALAAVNNPKHPSATTSKGTFTTSTIPVKIPGPTPVENPKHVFSPPSGIKIVSRTMTLPDGRTTVVGGQGSLTHPAMSRV